MAPEYLRSEPLDGRADLFALGVVLFESLAGERPYEGEHDPAIIMRILKGEHPPLTKLAPEAPQGLCQIIERLLEPDRENRPPNATVVIEVLDEFAPSSKVRRRLGQQVTDLRDHAEQNPLKSASRSNPKQTEALPETPGQKTGKSGTREAQPAEQAVGAKPSLEVPGAPEPTPPTFASGQTGTQAKSRRNLTLVALAAVLALGGVAAATAGLWVDTEETEESAETDALQVESDQRAGGDLPTEEPGSPAEDTLAGGEDTSDRASPSTERRAAASSPSSLGIKVRRTMDGANSSVVPRNVRSACRGFGTILPSNLARRNPEVRLVENLSGQGKRLVLEISYVKAKGGGAFSGAKKMEVTGKLMQGNRKVLGSFTAYRGSYKGKACKSLYRVEQEMAKDIALWLEEPGMYDKLGAAK
jgi:hypothetical protein